MTLKNDGELTDAIKLTLRKQGIVFDVDENAAVFNNELAAEGGDTTGGDNASDDNAGGETTGGDDQQGGDNAGGTNP